MSSFGFVPGSLSLVPTTSAVCRRSHFLPKRPCTLSNRLSRGNRMPFLEVVTSGNGGAAGIRGRRCDHVCAADVEFYLSRLVELSHLFAASYIAKSLCA